MYICNVEYDLYGSFEDNKEIVVLLFVVKYSISKFVKLKGVIKLLLYI